eukprot:53345_1
MMFAFVQSECFLLKLKTEFVTPHHLESMDLRIYNGILKERGVDPMAFDTKKKRPYPNGERAFRHDIFKGKTIWTNDRCTDFRLFIASFHPFVGLFTSCPHHPYTKRKRLITLLAMLCVGAFWASLSARFDKYNSTVRRYSFKLVASICNGTILFLMEICLRYCLSCPCRENMEHNCCNKCCKCITKTTLTLWVTIALVAFVAMVVLVVIYDIFATFIVIFTMQFVVSWTLQVGGLYMKFRKGWKKDTELMEKLNETDYMKDVLKDRKEKKFPYYVTYIDSNEWMERNPNYAKKKEWKEVDMVSEPLMIPMEEATSRSGNAYDDDMEELSMVSDSEWSMRKYHQ